MNVNSGQKLPPKPDVMYLSSLENSPVSSMNDKEDYSATIPKYTSDFKKKERFEKAEQLAQAALRAAEEAINAANAYAIARANVMAKYQKNNNTSKYGGSYVRHTGQPMPEDCSFALTSDVRDDISSSTIHSDEEEYTDERQSIGPELRDDVEYGSRITQDHLNISVQDHFQGEKDYENCVDVEIIESIDDAQGLSEDSHLNKQKVTSNDNQELNIVDENKNKSVGKEESITVEEKKIISTEGKETESVERKETTFSKNKIGTHQSEEECYSSGSKKINSNFAFEKSLPIPYDEEIPFDEVSTSHIHPKLSYYTRENTDKFLTSRSEEDKIDTLLKESNTQHQRKEIIFKHTNESVLKHEVLGGNKKYKIRAIEASSLRNKNKEIASKQGTENSHLNGVVLSEVRNTSDDKFIITKSEEYEVNAILKEASSTMKEDLEESLFNSYEVARKDGCKTVIVEDKGRSDNTGRILSLDKNTSDGHGVITPTGKKSEVNVEGTSRFIITKSEEDEIKELLSGNNSCNEDDMSGFKTLGTKENRTKKKLEAVPYNTNMINANCAKDISGTEEIELSTEDIKKSSIMKNEKANSETLAHSSHEKIENKPNVIMVGISTECNVMQEFNDSLITINNGTEHKQVHGEELESIKINIDKKQDVEVLIASVTEKEYEFQSKEFCINNPVEENTFPGANLVTNVDNDFEPRTKLVDARPAKKKLESAEIELEIESMDECINLSEIENVVALVSEGAEPERLLPTENDSNRACAKTSSKEQEEVSVEVQLKKEKIIEMGLTKDVAENIVSYIDRGNAIHNGDETHGERAITNVIVGNKVKENTTGRESEDLLSSIVGETDPEVQMCIQSLETRMRQIRQIEEDYSFEFHKHSMKEESVSKLVQSNVLTSFMAQSNVKVDSENISSPDITNDRQSAKLIEVNSLHEQQHGVLVTSSQYESSYTDNSIISNELKSIDGCSIKEAIMHGNDQEENLGQQSVNTTLDITSLRNISVLDKEENVGNDALEVELEMVDKYLVEKTEKNESPFSNDSTELLCSENATVYEEKQHKIKLIATTEKCTIVSETLGEEELTPSKNCLTQRENNEFINNLEKTKTPISQVNPTVSSMLDENLESLQIKTGYDEAESEQSHLTAESEAISFVNRGDRLQTILAIDETKKENNFSLVRTLEADEVYTHKFEVHNTTSSGRDEGKELVLADNVQKKMEDRISITESEIEEENMKAQHNNDWQELTLLAITEVEKAQVVRTDFNNDEKMSQTLEEVEKNSLKEVRNIFLTNSSDEKGLILVNNTKEGNTQKDSTNEEKATTTVVFRSEKDAFSKVLLLEKHEGEESCFLHKRKKNINQTVQKDSANKREMEDIFQPAEIIESSRVCKETRKNFQRDSDECRELTLVDKVEKEKIQAFEVNSTNKKEVALAVGMTESSVEEEARKDLSSINDEAIDLPLIDTLKEKKALTSTVDLILSEAMIQAAETEEQSSVKEEARKVLLTDSHEGKEMILIDSASLSWQREDEKFTEISCPSQERGETQRDNTSQKCIRQEENKSIIEELNSGQELQSAVNDKEETFERYVCLKNEGIKPGTSENVLDVENIQIEVDVNQYAELVSSTDKNILHELDNQDSKALRDNVKAVTDDIVCKEYKISILSFNSGEDDAKSNFTSCEDFENCNIVLFNESATNTSLGTLTVGAMNYNYSSNLNSETENGSCKGANSYISFDSVNATDHDLKQKENLNEVGNEESRESHRRMNMNNLFSSSHHILFSDDEEEENTEKGRYDVLSYKTSDDESNCNEKSNTSNLIRNENEAAALMPGLKSKLVKSNMEMEILHHSDENSCGGGCLVS